MFGTGITVLLELLLAVLVVLDAGQLLIPPVVPPDPPPVTPLVPVAP